MDLNTLDKNINANLYAMMNSNDPDELKNCSENILKLLSDNKALLKDNTNDNILIYIIIAVLLAVLVFSITNELLSILAVLIFAGVVLLMYIFAQITAHTIDGSVLLVDELSKKEWSLSTLDPVETWQEWEFIYPFINKGDMDDAIALRIYGKYEEYSFCYFEYDYTIEVEEEVEYEDSDGETYYETEYDYEYYTESGVIIKVDSNLPYIETSPYKYSNPLKFSYIELSERMSAYSSRPYEATSFFNPTMQSNFVEFYRRFPSSSISINKNYVFINFGTNLMNLPRSVKLDENLYSSIKRSNMSDKIEYIIQSLLPIINGVN